MTTLIETLVYKIVLILSHFCTSSHFVQDVYKEGPCTCDVIYLI